MSLQLYISHSGQRLQASAGQIVSPEALRQWIQEHTGIPSTRQILMTSNGKNVKQQHILSESEIFVYDRQYVTGEATPPSTANRPKPAVKRLREPPSTIRDETNLQSWQELFMVRRTWANEAADIVREGAESSQVYNDEIDVITRCAQVALDNLKNHVKTLQQKFEGTRKWAEDALEEHRSALNEWKAHFALLADLPVKSDVVELLQRPTTPTKHGSRTRDSQANLQGLIDNKNLVSSERTLSTASSSFGDQLHRLETEVQTFVKEAADIEKNGQFSWDGSETANSLFDESQALAERVNSDYDEVLRFPNNQKSLATASRRALVHTRELLPALGTLIHEVEDLQNASVIRRNEISENSFRALRNVSQLESRLAGLQQQIGGLDLENQGSEALESINKVFQLPIVYGSTLVEAVRRTEWTKNVNNDLTSVQNDLEGQKEDELRRRKKWLKSVGDFLDESDQEHAAVDLEIGFVGSSWPDVTSVDVQTYIEELKKLAINDAVAEVIMLMRNIEGKARRKSLKPFKNGSVHDLSNSSMVQANGEEVKLLQDEKSRLEDRLRASDSRIRKLEDVLHRQSQITRPPSSTFGIVTDVERRTNTPSPVPSSRPSELISRRSSNASRRLSNQNLDEKGLVQRIVGLESEISRLKQEAHNERRSSTENKDKMEEAESVKRDLMTNFESQKHEFDDERQLLEDESQKLKIRIEELEDELDRLAGSKDHLRMTTDQAVASLQAEVERFKRSSEEQSTKARNQYESIESSLNIQRDRAGSLEKQLMHHREEKSSMQTQNVGLANQLRELEQLQEDHLISLQAVHTNLSPQGSAPDDFKRLVRALEVLSEGSAIHMRGQDDALQLATAETKSLEEKVTHFESQTTRLSSRVEEEQGVSTTLRESLTVERSRLTALQEELTAVQAQLESLRASFAAGETGSEALKERLSQEEKRATQLSERAADAEARVTTAEQQHIALRTKVDSFTEREQSLLSQLDDRGDRAKELSQRLFQHNDRIIRMLEQMGYSVTRQDDRLVVQRASKVNSSTTLPQSTLFEASAAIMKRTISGSSPTQHYSDATDLDTLYWMSHADPGVEEEKFDAFVDVLSRLDLDATVETITKRYKDVESLAKKYQKDSRAYREKSHRLQSEAHEKIAYRNFKDGDLALFLPTRNQATRPWAAFNVGAPHYFLREQDSHKLQARDWLLARITKIEERVVDLSRSMGSNRAQADRLSINAEVASDRASIRSEDDNPFELSDGLRWYMIDACEEKPGAPSTPGLGKSTVAASNVEVKGSMGKKVEKSGAAVNAANIVTKTLNRSLDSRRSSSASKHGGGGAHTPSPSLTNAPTAILPMTSEQTTRRALSPTPRDDVTPSDADLAQGQQPAREDNEVFNIVRKDLLLGP